MLTHLRCASIVTSLVPSLVFLALAACAAAPRKQRGAQCELNSECDAPLVCRIGACRKECATTRDCAAPAQCLLDDAGLGSCQLDTELHCARASDCTPPLVCASGSCVTACNEDRDCAAGATCMDHGCVDSARQACVRDSECGGAPLVCALDGRCRIQCTYDRECRYGTHCDLLMHACVPPPVGPPDAGPPDAGSDAMVSPPCRFTTSTVTAAAINVFGGCAIVNPGEVWCWGTNHNGSLGVPGYADLATAMQPVSTGITGATQIAASNLTTCVITTTGDLSCWGDNTYGQLALPTTTAFSDTPVLPLGAGRPATAVAIGIYAAYAVVSGTPYGWGDRSWSALADGATSGTQTTPSAIPLGGVPTQLVGMEWGACALLGGTPRCWGYNGAGVIGAGLPWPTTHNATTPTPVSGITDATQISATVTPVCALRPSGVSCWGDDTNGACGDAMHGSSTAPLFRTTPVSVVGLVAPTFVAAGNDFACAIDSGDVRCWGSNAAGALGDGTTTDRDAPGPPIPLPAPAVAIYTGMGYQACALLTDQTLWCWGDGWLPDGSMPATRTGTVPVRACLP